MDSSPYHGSKLPGKGFTRAAKRDDDIYATVWQDVPLLGMRRRLQSLDERWQRATREQQGRLWTMDVRGAQCCERKVGQEVV